MAGLEALTPAPRPGIPALSTRSAPLWRDPRYDDCDHEQLSHVDSWGWRACRICACSIPPDWHEYPLRHEDPALVDHVVAEITRGVAASTAFEAIGVPPRLYRAWLSDTDDPRALWLQARIRRARAEARADLMRRMFLTDPKWWAAHGPEARGRGGAHEDAFGEAPRDLRITQDHTGTVSIDVTRIPLPLRESILDAYEAGAAIDVTPID